MAAHYTSYKQPGASEIALMSRAGGLMRCPLWIATAVRIMLNASILPGMCCCAAVLVAYENPYIRGCLSINRCLRWTLVAGYLRAR